MTASDMSGAPGRDLLLTAEAARLLHVHPRTLLRWETAGRFPPGAVIRTLGGHRRFRASAIQQLLDGYQS